MRHLIDLLTNHTPVFEPFGSLIVIVAIFVAAWIVTRASARFAAWLVDRGDRRRSGDPKLLDTGVLTGIRQRETAILLVQTSVRYVAFGIAIVLAIAIAFGARQIDAVVGASFLAILIGFSAQRFLTDVIAGLLMFFEGWFRVGDTILIEPSKVQGVVEEVSIRSIKVRGLDGDVMRVPNSSVTATRVTPRGLRRIEVEVYVSDLGAGTELADEVARIVPVGPTHFVRRPVVQETERLDGGLHRITIAAVVPPGREWLAQEFLPSLLRERASEGLILHGPIALPSDDKAISRFAEVERRASAPRRVHTTPFRRRIRRT